MEWLSYSDDEVLVFHPAFESFANDVLKTLKLDAAFEWVHHDPNASGGIPDYVLRELGSNQWVLVVEIKKTRSAVTSSTHYRRQAHSYALENKTRFRNRRPFLYCLTNLEHTQLFGANDVPDLAFSPNARQIASWNHGDFRITAEQDHRKKFSQNLQELVSLCVGATVPLTFKLNFPIAWEAIQAAGLNTSGVLPASWSDGTAEAWFSNFEEEASKGLLLAIRCLLAEWIVFQCEQHGHPNSASMTRLKLGRNASRTRNSVADTLDRILQVDFEAVIGGNSTPTDLRGINDAGALAAIQTVVEQLQQLKLDQLSDLVGNSGLPDVLFELLQNRIQKSRRGTVQTDPELARVAAVLGFHQRPNTQFVVDPCAGIGNLLVAAFYELTGLEHADRLPRIAAIEIDPIQASLAALQLTMQVPALASLANQPVVLCDSLTNQSKIIASSGLILLNPPYKRYEDDGDPLPEGFRQYLDDAIKKLRGVASATTGGQSDLYNFYVEFVIAAMSDGARGVFVLNNKWMSTKTTLPLRKFLLEQCCVESLIQYPRGEFFEDHLITTSLLVFTKGGNQNGNVCRFVRCLEDLRLIGENDVTGAAFDGTPTSKVQVSSHSQSDVTAHTSGDTIGSWRTFFPNPTCLATLSLYPKLVNLFGSVVQGRLERDEVSKAFSFPFRDWRKKGTCGQNRESKVFKAGADRSAPSGAVVRTSTLQKLTAAAEAIPDNYRGFALKVAHKMGGNVDFVLKPTNFSHTYEDGSSDAVIEPPELRGHAWDRGSNKSRWTSDFDDALDAMRNRKDVGPFVALVESDLGGSNRPAKIIWEDLLRPCAGELILLRAFRSGWRAHLNPLAFDPDGRQVRLSSNFYSFRGIRCTEEEIEKGVNEELTKTVLAFLISSFGQIQFEFYGQNREGLRKCEKATCIENIRAPDPATIAEDRRAKMIGLLEKVSCPISCESHPHADPSRRALDTLIAAHMLGRETHDISVLDLVDTVALELDELQRERLG